jgi:hypothetical protein
VLEPVVKAGEATLALLLGRFELSPFTIDNDNVWSGSYRSDGDDSLAWRHALQFVLNGYRIHVLQSTTVNEKLLKQPEKTLTKGLPVKLCKTIMAPSFEVTTLASLHWLLAIPAEREAGQFALPQLELRHAHRGHPSEHPHSMTRSAAWTRSVPILSKAFAQTPPVLPDTS